MGEESKSLQPGLFDSAVENVRIDEVIRYALGDFQKRGLVLEERKLALDRLLGAFRRAFERFGIEPLEDSNLVDRLAESGAFIEEVPDYVAKHPYRVTVPAELAESSREFYAACVESDSEPA